MKKAILFDVDGTLLDTWDFVIGAFKHTVTSHGQSIPSEKQIKKAMGKPLLEFYKTVFPDKDANTFGKTHRDFQKGKFDLGKPFPKALQTLKSLKSSGFLIAVVSNRTRNSLLISLKKAKFLEFLDLVISAEDVKNPKPHKEHLIVALNRFKVKKINAFMVGDTENDILAGKNAGIKTVGVTYGFFGESIKDANPDFVIDNIEELLEILK